MTAQTLALSLALLAPPGADSACVTAARAPRPDTAVTLASGRRVRVLEVTADETGPGRVVVQALYVTRLPRRDSTAERAEALDVARFGAALAGTPVAAPNGLAARVRPCRAGRPGEPPRSAREWAFVRDSAGRWRPVAR